MTATEPTAGGARESRRRRWPVLLALLSPALLLYLVFLVFPIAQGIRFSVYDWLFIGSFGIGIAAMLIALAFPPFPDNRREQAATA